MFCLGVVLSDRFKYIPAFPLLEDSPSLSCCRQAWLSDWLWTLNGLLSSGSLKGHCEIVLLLFSLWGEKGSIQRWLLLHPGSQREENMEHSYRNKLSYIKPLRLDHLLPWHKPVKVNTRPQRNTVKGKLEKVDVAIIWGGDSGTFQHAVLFVLVVSLALGASFPKVLCNSLSWK